MVMHAYCLQLQIESNFLDGRDTITKQSKYMYTCNVIEALGGGERDAGIFIGHHRIHDIRSTVYTMYTIYTFMSNLSVDHLDILSQRKLLLFI